MGPVLLDGLEAEATLEEYLERMSSRKRASSGEALWKPREKGPEKEVQSVVARAADRAIRGFGTLGSRK